METTEPTRRAVYLPACCEGCAREHDERDMHPEGSWFWCRACWADAAEWTHTTLNTWERLAWLMWWRGVANVVRT